MATERNDSQIGHALAQGPLMTDIVAALSTNSGWNPKVSRPVEQEKPTNNKLEMERLPDGDQERSDRLLRGNEGCREILQLWMGTNLYCGVQSVTLLLLRVQRYCRGQLPPTRQVNTSLFPSNTTCCRAPLPRRYGATSDTEKEINK